MIAMFSAVMISNLMTGCGVSVVAPAAATNPVKASEAFTTDNTDFSTMAVSNPELKKELENLKNLPKEQRQAKLDELKKKYPDDFKNMKPGMGKHFGHRGFGFGPGGNMKNLETTNPDLAKDLKALKDDMKTKMDALKAKYPDAFKNMKGNNNRFAQFTKEHPDLAKDLEALKGLSNEERKAKMEELKKKYPDVFKGWQGKKAKA